MESYRTLQNTSGVPQSVVHKGVQHVIAPHGEESFTDEVADKFMEYCSPVVVDTTIDKAGGKTYAPDFDRDTTWIANMTGNPDVPKNVKIRRYLKDHLRVSEVEVKNPNYEPRTYKATLKGGHEQYIAKDGGLVQISLDSRVLEVPPFKRRPFKTAHARWLLGRDANCEVRGAIIESRPPADFEPDMTWKLSDMRAYARLLDPTMDLGVDEDMLAKKAAKSKWDEKVLAEELRKVKQLLLRRLYFRIVDPKYRLPTKKEFNEFLTGKSEEELAKEELSKILETATKDITKTEVKLSRDAAKE